LKEFIIFHASRYRLQATKCRAGQPEEEVGAAAGIPQSYNFSKWFKIITEMTPFRYRKENSK
jgi:methylphosphotriester-DNA--protein-cysteine methyltransferase